MQVDSPMECCSQAAADPNSIPQRQVAIHVRDVTLQYNNKATVLNGLTLDVPGGSICAILGPSGCGKTSLIRCILGMLKPSTGSINLFGQSPNSSYLNGSSIGYMPQDIFLSPKLTIGATLTNVGTNYGLKVPQLTERCQFLARFLDLPQTEQLVGVLSDEQKRRLSLANALIHKPSLLLLDEPTVGVEPALRKSIWQYLVELSTINHVTVLFTTKYIEEAKYANLIGLMCHGRILAQGSCTALLAHYQMTTIEQVCFRLFTEAESNLSVATLSLQNTTANSDAVLLTVSPMTRNINHLPDLCLYSIFCLFPVRDLPVLARVCTKWRSMQQKVALLVNKVTLVISGSDPTTLTFPPCDQVVNADGSLMCPKQKFPSRHSVHFEWFDMNALIGWTVRLPNVTTLEIAFQMSSPFQLCGVTILLRLWQAKMVTFKLLIDSDLNRIPEQAYGPLIEAINSCSSLKHLSLVLFNSSFDAFDRDNVQLDLPILSQLDSFYLYSTNESDVLLNTLRTSAVPNAKLRIVYGNETMTWRETHLEPYYQIGSLFCSKFDWTPFIQLLPGLPLKNYCSHFNAVTKLDLIMPEGGQFKILHLFKCLSLLTQLIKLYVWFNFQFVAEDIGDALLARLPSIKSLELHVFDLAKHNDLSRLKIPITMPNLQVIQAFVGTEDMEHRCELCGFDELENHLTREELQHCLSQVLMPFGGCTSLKIITGTIQIHREYVNLERLTIDDLKKPLNLN